MHVYMCIYMCYTSLFGHKAVNNRVDSSLFTTTHTNRWYVGVLILPKCPERVYRNSTGKVLGFPCGFYYHQSHLKPLLGASHWSSVLDGQCAFKINLVTSYYLFFFFFLFICALEEDSSLIPLGGN